MLNCGLQLIIIYQYWFVSYNKCILLTWDVNNRETQGLWWVYGKGTVHSVWFFYKPKATQKIMSSNLKITLLWHINIRWNGNFCVSKVLLKHNQTFSFKYYLWLLWGWDCRAEELQQRPYGSQTKLGRWWPCAHGLPVPEAVCARTITGTQPAAFPQASCSTIAPSSAGDRHGCARVVWVTGELVQWTC